LCGEHGGDEVLGLAARMLEVVDVAAVAWKSSIKLGKDIVAGGSNVCSHEPVAVYDC